MTLLYSRHLTVGALGLCSLIHALPAAAEALPGDTDTVLQAVTVESRRRADDAQQVPVAMSVLGG